MNHSRHRSRPVPRPVARAVDPDAASAGTTRDPTLPDVLARGFHTIVRGHAFSARPTGSRELPVGTDLRLVRESDNPADAFAVAVWTRDPDGWRIGYLDRSVSARLAAWLDAGRDVEATVRGWTSEPDGRWRRPVIAVSSPSVVSRVHVAEEPGRYTREDRATSTTGLWGRPPGARRRVIA